MSNSLQTGLAIGGGLILAGIVAHGAWTARRNAPRKADFVPSQREWAPDADGRNALRDTQPMGDDAYDAYGDGSRTEPTLDLSAIATPRRRPGLDPLIDSITTIELDVPVSGEAVLAALPTSRRVGSKPFMVEGLLGPHGEWETPMAGRRYMRLQAGLQLANRMGALNDIEFSECVIKVQAFADTVGGTPEFPDMRHEVARGRELDQFASGHDAQLSFTLRAHRAAWSPGFIQQSAAKLGFVAAAVSGRMVLPGQVEGQQAVLTLQFDPRAAMADDPEKMALRDVVLALDVPQVEQAEAPFLRMREMGAALCQAMDAALTDDQGQPLTLGALDAIAVDLDALYVALASRELPAGAPTTRRLFS